MSWRRLRTLLRREILATYRDPFTMTILVSVPLLALLLFGHMLSTEVNELALGVFDANQTGASRRLVAELEADGSFVPRTFENRAALEKALVAGKLGAAIVIPADFDRLLSAPRAELPELQLLYDGGEAVLAGNAEAFLRTIVTNSVARLRREAHPGGSAPSVGVRVTTRGAFNPKLDGTPFMVAGTFGFVLSFLTVLITAVSIVNERITGTFEQLQVTPATALEILLGKLLPLGAVFAFDVVLMVLVAGFVLGVWPTGSAVFFVAVSSYYVLVSLAIGLIISATSATAGEAVQKSVLFSIPLVQLSGFAFPIRNMPTVVQWLTQIFPATHYIRVTRAIYLRGEGPLSLLPELAMIGLFGVVLIAVARRTIEARA